MTNKTTCNVIHRPESEALCFLPEGPYSIGPNRFSWVGIQHGADSSVGSVNIFDAGGKTNTSYDLPGRPGFAFPTSREGVFVAGIERSLGLFDTVNGGWEEIATGIEDEVDNTIINDGVCFGDKIVFGCKDLEFQTQKAGLYLYNHTNRKVSRLRDDQICSNGKAVLPVDGKPEQFQFFDIDSPSKQVTHSILDTAQETISESRVIVDVTDEEIFPDGMILTPDAKSVIIAFYDPGDPLSGVARQYGIESGNVEYVWECPASPRVTCPQLVEIDGTVKLILTTAVEHMEPDQREKHPNAGCLFVGDTPFNRIGDQPRLVV